MNDGNWHRVVVEQLLMAERMEAPRQFDTGSKSLCDLIPCHGV